MALSEHEQRQLEEIERGLMADDPKLSRDLDKGKASGRGPFIQMQDSIISPTLPWNWWSRSRQTDRINPQPLTNTNWGRRVIRGGIIATTVGILYVWGASCENQSSSVQSMGQAPTSEINKAPQLPKTGVIARLPIS